MGAADALDELLDEPGVRCPVCGPAPGCSCRTEELDQRNHQPSNKTRRPE